jgi:hypothetical protein
MRLDFFCYLAKEVGRLVNIRTLFQLDTSKNVKFKTNFYGKGIYFKVRKGDTI